MPNWCENVLTVSGPKKDVEEFAEFSKDEDGPLTFNRHVPYPEKFRIQDAEAERMRKELDAMPEPARNLWLRLNGGYPKDGYNSGGYEWCNNNWGTKWDIDHIEVVEGPRSRTYYFDTAWSPPILAVLSMSKNFPTLHFTLTYKEEDNDFRGISRFFAGAIS